MTDEFFMAQALKQAELALEADEVPVGCIIVKNQQIIGIGYNQQISMNDPTAHAEIIAIRDAAKNINNYRLVESTLYSTLEPCTMCLGAIIHARINKVVFAASDNKTGCLGGCTNLAENKCFNHKIIVNSGILKDKSKLILQEFFKNKRKK